MYDGGCRQMDKGIVMQEYEPANEQVYDIGI